MNIFNGLYEYVRSIPLFRNDMNRTSNFTVTINFPALDAFASAVNNVINYLQSADQKKIDDLATQVNTLTAGLHNSSSELKQAVDESKS